MRKAKSREEILDSMYITKTETQRLLGESYKTASRVYEMAIKKDQQELGDRAVFIYGEKARITSVCWAYGIKLKDLKSGQ